MRRTLIILCLYLLLGLAINILVAWGCALGSEYRLSSRPGALTRSEVRQWIDRSPWPYKLRFGQSLRSGTRGLQYDLLKSDGEDPNFWHAARAVRAGLPLPSLYGERWTNNAKSEGEHAFVAALDPATLGLSDESFRVRLLPLQPLFPGIITNTVFYALLLWLAFSTPRRLKARGRLRSGLCPNCGENLSLQNLDRCSSCTWILGVTNHKSLSK